MNDEAAEIALALAMLGCFSDAEAAEAYRDALARALEIDGVGA